MCDRFRPLSNAPHDMYREERMIGDTPECYISSLGCIYSVDIPEMSGIGVCGENLEIQCTPFLPRGETLQPYCISACREQVDDMKM